MRAILICALILFAGCQSRPDDYFLDIVRTPKGRIYVYSHPHSRRVEAYYYDLDGRLERVERIDR